MEKKIPLVVDLDGSLVKGDTFLEAIIEFIKLDIFNVLRILVYLIHSKAYLKNKIAKKIIIDPKNLIYEKAVLDLIKQEKKDNKKIILCSASNQKQVDSVSKYLNIFDKAIGSSESLNLRGYNKMNYLTSLFKDKGYDYVGNDKSDISVWSKARKIYTINTNNHVIDSLNKENLIKLVPRVSMLNKIYYVAKSLRLHQWVKNVLIFLPMILAQQFSLINLKLSLLAFLVFGLASSIGYIFNDLLDVQSDRLSPSKKLRPFASSHLDLKDGFIIMTSLSLISIYIIMNFISNEYLFVVFGYLFLSMLYTLVIKKIIGLDILFLTSLYILRVFAGGNVTSIEVSIWLIIFCIFIFLYLSSIKRISELKIQKNQEESGHKISSVRGYLHSDLPIIQQISSSSGLISILVLALYFRSSEVIELYKNPELLMLICPILLFWIIRISICTHRGQMHEDPIIFTLKDPYSITIGTIVLFIMIFQFI